MRSSLFPPSSPRWRDKREIPKSSLLYFYAGNDCNQHVEPHKYIIFVILSISLKFVLLRTLFVFFCN